MSEGGGRGVSLPMWDSWLGGKSDNSGGGDSSTDLIENTTPPLVIISSRVKSPGSLASCVNEGVVVIKYSYESTSLGKLLQLVSSKLRGRPALCIALLVDGNQAALKLCSQKVLSESSVREDQEVRDFMKQLVTHHLNRESRYARLDLLLCPLAGTTAGELLLKKLRPLLGVPVFTAGDILGPCISEAEGSIPIGTLYFDKKRLNEQWNSQPQTMALFEKIRIVGKGAYGAAVLYRKKDDNSLVILKEINLMDLSKQERSLALNEVQILSMLDHTYIISYYDHFEEDGVLMIEMEYADGGTLTQFLRQQTTPMPERDILLMFYKMVDALRYLHEHRILHRDLKTANIFLTKEGGVKLGDFGISKVLTATHAEANTVLGTPFYISPEICEGKAYNTKSDIWALGCILYEMACLEKTFEGTNLPAVIHKIVQVSFPPIRGGYSEGFRRLVTDMLQKEPQQRPSANDLYTVRLVELIGREEEEAEPEEPTDITKAKSFLYHLDCHSFLLKPVPTLTIKPLIDHVAVGYGHIVAVTLEHTVFSWGEGGRGQLGHGDTVSRSSPQLVDALKSSAVIRAECGGEFTIFITENRIIMSCGRGSEGALGHGPAALEDGLKPRLIEELLSKDTVGVACGESHVVAITSDGVFTWGEGTHGRLGNGREDMCPTPLEVSVKSAGRMEEVICAVRCGLDGTMFLTETGRVYSCGNNQYNKLGLNQRQTFIDQMRRILNKANLQVHQALVATPIKELGKHRVVDMAIGPTHSSLVVETGKVFTFGRNSEGQLCAGSVLPQTTPTLVKGLTGKPMTVTCSELATIVTTQENSFLVWGSRPFIQTPLHAFLSQTDHTTPPDHTPSTPSNVVARRKESNTTKQAVTFEIGSPDPQPDSVGIGGPNIGGPNVGGGPPSVGGSREQMHRASSLNLTNTPHHMTKCSQADQYLKTLAQQLSELPNHHGKISVGGAVGRRGVSVTSEAGLGGLDKEGVILEPTSVDLVGRCGLLSALSAQGLQQAKLEGVGNFAGNVLILIQAKVPEEEEEPRAAERGQRSLKVSPPKQALLMMSKRLVQRRHWNPKTPRLSTPVMPEFKPPQSSDFEPTLSAHLEPIRNRIESEPRPLPVEPHPLTRDRKQPLILTDEEDDKPHPLSEDEDLEESKVPTWVLQEMKLANADHTPKPRPLRRSSLSMEVTTLPPDSHPPPLGVLASMPPRSFAATPDISKARLLHQDFPLNPTLSPFSLGQAPPTLPPIGPAQTPRIASATSKKLQIEPIRLPTARGLKPAASTSSITGGPPKVEILSKGGALRIPQGLKPATSTNSILAPRAAISSSKGVMSQLDPLNVKKSRSTVDLPASGGGAPWIAPMPRQQSLTQVRTQLARISLSSSRQSTRRATIAGAGMYGARSSNDSSVSSSPTRRRPSGRQKTVAGAFVAGRYGSHSSDSSCSSASSSPTRRRPSQGSLGSGLLGGSTPPPRGSPPLGHRARRGSIGTSSAEAGREGEQLPQLAAREKIARQKSKSLVGTGADSAMVGTADSAHSKREGQLEGEIARLKGEMAKQQDMLKENLEAMRALQEQMQSIATPSPATTAPPVSPAPAPGPTPGPTPGRTPAPATAEKPADSTTNQTGQTSFSGGPSSSVSASPAKVQGAGGRGKSPAADSAKKTKTRTKSSICVIS